MSNKLNDNELKNVSGGCGEEKYHFYISGHLANGYIVCSATTDHKKSYDEVVRLKDEKVKEIFAAHPDVTCCRVYKYYGDIAVGDEIVYR